MAFNRVNHLVPGFIISGQDLGHERLILFVFELKSSWPRNYAIYLVENYELVDTLSGLYWDSAEGFLRSCYRDSGGVNDRWWELICERVREQGGAVAT